MGKCMGFLAAGVILLLLIPSALAYNTEGAEITINTDGSAIIVGSYQLNLGEYIAFKFTQGKENLLKDAIEQKLGRDVTVNYMNDKEVSVTIPSFAKVDKTENKTSYKTPKLPYNEIGNYMDNFLKDNPVLKNFSPDASMVVPDKTVIIFPDGYSVTYEKPYLNGVVLPVTH